MIAAEERACKVSAPAWFENPYRLVSLREIVMEYGENEIHLGPFGNVYYALGVLDIAAMSQQQGMSIGQRDQIQMQVILDVYIPEMKRLGLRVSATHAESVVKILEGKDSTLPMGSLHDYITMLRTALATELDATAFLPVSQTEAPYYREPLGGITEEAQDRFSSTLDDLREASKCYALGRCTGSVFHCMRAVEVGLVALGEHLKVPAAKNKNWQELLNEINKAIKQVSEQTHGAGWRDERQWYSEVSAHLQVIKDAWRNDVMHVHRSYNQARSREILNSTRAFMCQIATRLKE